MAGALIGVLFHFAPPAGAATPCVGGMAGPYPCRNVDLMALVTLPAMGCAQGNTVWGWTDPLTGKEYALMGCTNGVSFLDVSDPENPRYLGRLPTQTFNSTSRDIKVYADHAFVVSEAPGHGLQVFDLRQLRSATGPPVVFTPSALYEGFLQAHTIALDEATGFAFAMRTATCGRGLHIVDVRNPATPVFAGCFSQDGATHDAQCVVYAGPDARYRGRELCFASNEDTLTIVDVTDKTAPVMLSRTGYAGSSYTHQGWLTEDHRYFLLDDENDELNFGHNTRTYVWEISLLDAPKAPWTYTATTTATDHNLYVRGRYVYQANYRAGLRVLDLNDIARRNLSEVAFFDTFPSGDAPGTVGAWNSYPFFASGIVLVSGIDEGLFVLRPAIPPEGLRFYTVTPCRVADTRDPAGPSGGPALSPGEDRRFPIGGRCGIPGTARAVALNVTVAGPTAQGSLRIYPGSVLPAASVVNYRGGQVRSNNSIVGLSGGGLTVRADQATGSVHVLMDVTGYFD